MARIPEYGPKPATLRRTLTVALAKALAHYQARHPEKASRWAEHLIVEMVKAHILKQADADHAAETERWRKSP